MGEGRRWRVHVEYWGGYVNVSFNSLDDAKSYQERMLKKEYVEHATISEEPTPKYI